MRGFMGEGKEGIYSTGVLDREKLFNLGYTCIQIICIKLWNNPKWEENHLITSFIRDRENTSWPQAFYYTYQNW